MQRLLLDLWFMASQTVLLQYFGFDSKNCALIAFCDYKDIHYDKGYYASIYLKHGLSD